MNIIWTATSSVGSIILYSGVYQTTLDMKKILFLLALVITSVNYSNAAPGGGAALGLREWL